MEGRERVMGWLVEIICTPTTHQIPSYTYTPAVKPSIMLTWPDGWVRMVSRGWGEGVFVSPHPLPPSRLFPSWLSSFLAIMKSYNLGWWLGRSGGGVGGEVTVHPTNPSLHTPTTHRSLLTPYNLMPGWNRDLKDKSYQKTSISFSMERIMMLYPTGGVERREEGRRVDGVEGR